MSTIQNLTTYKTFNKLNSNRKYGRIKNFFSIYLWNCVFGIILIPPIIFLINTFFPFEKPGDFDFAFITAVIILPGFLLSLRLLTNPVRIKPKIPLLILLVMPEIELPKIRELKERISSFYFSFVETAVFSVIILYFYQIMKNRGSESVYSNILTKITPQNSILVLFFLILGVFLAIFITTSISEYLLEKYNPIIQE